MHHPPQKEWLAPAREGQPRVFSGSSEFGNMVSSYWVCLQGADVADAGLPISQDEEVQFWCCNTR
jgi:hypothetical protein